MTKRITQNTISELQDAQIEEEDLLTLFEAAHWVLHSTSVSRRFGTHADIADWYLDELKAKVHKYMNPPETQT
jgi:hypothetical protein